MKSKMHMQYTKALTLAILMAWAVNNAEAQHNKTSKTIKMETGTTAQNKALIRSLYEDIINNRRLERLDEVIAPAFEGAGAKGPQGFRNTVTDLVTAFPDIRFKIEDMIAEGDKVVARWSWTGTHSAPFRGYPTSHRQIHNEALVMYQIADGKITHSWLQSDRLGGLQQMGVTLQAPEK